MEPDYLNYESIQLLSRTKLEILNQSLFRPKFYSTIIEYEIGDTFTMYKLEYGILDSDGKHIQIYRTRTRYSILLQLYEEMKHLIGNSNLPSFPPKRYCGNNTNKLATERLIQLNQFVQKINTFTGCQELPKFKEIFQEYKYSDL